MPIPRIDSVEPVTILLVDDSSANRARRRIPLEAAGFQVVEADSGAACEAAVADRWPEIVLLDVTLADTSGFDLTRCIKALASEAQRHTAVLLISPEFRNSASRIESLESGADGYLTEPMSDAELVASLRAVTRGLQVVSQALASERALREADRAKTEFLATVSHELRQPLNAALAALEVMKTRRDRAKGEKARDALGRQLQQMRVIVEDLLDATQVVRRQVPLNAQPEDLRNVLHGALETARPPITERQQQLSFTVPTVPVVLHADAARLQQVFVNLLSNASRYTPNGGAIDLRLDVTATAATVRVSDTGAGIAPEHLPHIFDLFSRGTTAGKGLGIGLAVARQLVELHGGTIEACSAGVGRGCEFVVSFPAPTV